MKKITQKQLIDYCNNAPWGHCSICPYDSKECKIYCTKYGTPPAGEHYNPERYTDEDISPIQLERQKGKWVDGRCNKCGGYAPFRYMALTYRKSNFCPNCGADMRGEQDE